MLNVILFLLGVDPALEAYAARVASHGADVGIVDATAANPCGADEFLWRRALDIEFCAPQCTSDLDYIEGFERCADIPLPGSAVPDRVFLDDQPELQSRIESANRETVHAAEGAVYDIVAVCDPFFDAEGS